MGVNQGSVEIEYDQTNHLALIDLTHVGPGGQDQPASAGVCPGRLWSLWDLMNHSRTPYLCRMTGNIATYIAYFETARFPEQLRKPPSPERFAKWLERFREYVQECQALFLEMRDESAAKHFLLILEHLSRKHVDPSTASVEASHARAHLENELEKFRFLYVPPDRSSFLDRDDLFGDDVKKKFPAAMEDLCEAGNCLACDCNTAAVFHLMRVVEWGLRAFCGHLGFVEVVEKYDRTGLGQHEYRPIEYATWDKILGQLRGAVENKIATIQDRGEKQAAQEFYHPIVEEISAMKDAWRNHVMHCRQRYSAEDVIAILSHVKRLFTTLAKRVSEV